MLRYFAGAGSALLLIMAGFFIWTGTAQDESEDPVADPPAESATPVPLRSGPPERPPSADERTKEQRRFDRSDRDRNGRVSLEELVYPRRRAFDRLDTDHDGRLSFEEWGVRTLAKFAEADADRDRTLTRPEFATTAPRRRPVTRRQNCSC
jgi:hypothetical protein